MTIDVHSLETLEIRDMRFACDVCDTMLYALSVGMGADPLFDMPVRSVTSLLDARLVA